MRNKEKYRPGSNNVKRDKDKKEQRDKEKSMSGSRNREYWKWKNITHHFALRIRRIIGRGAWMSN